MTDPWPLRSSLELGALPTAAPCACVHTQLLLWEWGLNSLAESAELLVSELVTNAVNATAGQDGQVVSLHLSGNATQVLIEVHDADPQPPGPRDPRDPREPREPSEENFGARDGVLLVAALSTRWDWYPTEDPPGKVVWCELTAPPPEPAGPLSGPVAIPSEPAAPLSAPVADTSPPPPESPSPLESLPRRIPRARTKPQAEIVTDLDLLRRLRDHLLS
jgi:anti-sigma regulatory factor (Ser/Thr protein kinase)